MATYKDPSEQAIHCPDRGYQKPLLGCLTCRRFPCAAINKERMTLLEVSPFVRLEFNGFTTRRKIWLSSSRAGSNSRERRSRVA